MREPELLERLLDLHERIRSKVIAAQERSALGRLGEATDRTRDASGGVRAANAEVAAEGAADISFGIDVEAESVIEEFAEEFAKETPILVVSEGLGVRAFGTAGRTPEWRLVIDPIDGTRNLMFDLRSGFVLSAFAPEKGDATRLSDVRVALQTELPPTDRRSFDQMSAIRGQGARIVRRDLATGAIRSEQRLERSDDARLDNGFFVFFKFNFRERGVLGAIEQRFFELLVESKKIDGRLLFDDQYICSAGQLQLMLTRRYRFLADLRGFVGDRLGFANQTSKPYDVCCALIAEEAGILLTDGRGEKFDVPLDLESRVTLVAYPNAAVRAALEPLLFRAMAEILPLHTNPHGNPVEGRS